MHKNVLAIVVALIGIGVGVFFTIFTLPISLSENTANALKEIETGTTQSQNETATADITTTDETNTASSVDTVSTSTTELNTTTVAPDSQVNTSPSTVTVTYTDNGFSPKLNTIKKGTAVRFVNNNTSKPMWVASNDHPSHEIYSEFDQGTAVTKGGSYSFTFTKVGSWNFHNHLSPNDGGTITITN